ncbi:MAG: hypothetical protein IT349_21725 [Candidatus Eisenbacteria bacterium]|nr:hypothetical protein [Candidatus Eisenbacteria bacterium]
MVLVWLEVAPTAAEGQLCATWRVDLDAANVAPPIESRATGSILASYESCSDCAWYEGDSLVLYISGLRDFSSPPLEARIFVRRFGEQDTLLANVAIPGESMLRFPVNFPLSLCSSPLEEIGYATITTANFPEGEATGSFIWNPPSPTIDTTWGSVRARYRPLTR